MDYDESRIAEFLRGFELMEDAPYLADILLNSDSTYTLVKLSPNGRFIADKEYHVTNISCLGQDLPLQALINGEPGYKLRPGDHLAVGIIPSAASS
jgi:hypothetical protein